MREYTYYDVDQWITPTYAIPEPFLWVFLLVGFAVIMGAMFNKD